MTGYDKKQGCCNSYVENKYTDSNDESYIRCLRSDRVLQFVAYHYRKKQTAFFEVLVDSGSSNSHQVGVDSQGRVEDAVFLVSLHGD